MHFNVICTFLDVINLFNLTNLSDLTSDFRENPNATLSCAVEYCFVQVYSIVFKEAASSRKTFEVIIYINSVTLIFYVDRLYFWRLLPES